MDSDSFLVDGCGNVYAISSRSDNRCARGVGTRNRGMKWSGFTNGLKTTCDKYYHKNWSHDSSTQMRQVIPIDILLFQNGLEDFLCGVSIPVGMWEGPRLVGGIDHCEHRHTLYSSQDDN